MTLAPDGLSGAADRLTAWLWRWRRLLAALSVLGAVLLAPLADIRTLDNDVSAWFQTDDPVYRDYERLKKEFPGSRTLIIALESPDAFAPEMLEALRVISSEIEQVQAVRRVQSLATANVVRLRPAETEDDLRRRAAGAAERARSTPPPCDAPRSPTACWPATSCRPAGACWPSSSASTRRASTTCAPPCSTTSARAWRDTCPSRPRAHYNGALEISETYNRVTLRNQVLFTPPILLIIIAAIYVMFRSARLTVLTLFAVLVSTLWTVGLYMWAGYGFNVLTSMLPPLVLVLAIADDVHIIQHYTQCRREGAGHEAAWKHTVRHLITPLLAASGTTALGLLSLATSPVDAVRTFGLGAALGVMVDFVVSIVLMPTLLGLVVVPAEPPPQARWLLGPMRAIGRIATTYPGRVLTAASMLLVVVGFGLTFLRVDTNHVAFFKPGHPLHDSAELMDRELSGIYSFQVMLEGPPESLASARGAPADGLVARAPRATRARAKGGGPARLCRARPRATGSSLRGGASRAPARRRRSRLAGTLRVRPVRGWPPGARERRLLRLHAHAGDGEARLDELRRGLRRGRGGGAHRAGALRRHGDRAHRHRRGPAVRDARSLPRDVAGLELRHGVPLRVRRDRARLPVRSSSASWPSSPTWCRCSSSSARWAGSTSR